MEATAPIALTRKPLIIPNPVVDGDSEPEAPEVYYYVLQAGRIAGPFTIKRVLEMALTKTVGKRDFVQIAGASEWLPLPRALDPDMPLPDGMRPAPDWRTIADWAWLRLRYNLDEKSLSAGCFCLSIAVLGVSLSQWSVAYWGPLMLPPIIAGVALLLRKRFIAGLILLLAVTMVPLLAMRWVGFAS